MLEWISDINTLDKVWDGAPGHQSNQALVESDTDVNCPIVHWTNPAVAVVFMPVLKMMSARPTRRDAIAAADQLR